MSERRQDLLYLVEGSRAELEKIARRLALRGILAELRPLSDCLTRT